MEPLLEVITSAFYRPGVTEYVKFLITSGSEKQELVRAYINLMGATCLLHLSQKRERLSSSHRAAVENFLQNEELSQALKMFAVELSALSEPVALMASLGRHASTVCTLSEQLDLMLVSALAPDADYGVA